MSVLGTNDEPQIIMEMDPATSIGSLQKNDLPVATTERVPGAVCSSGL